MALAVGPIDVVRRLGSWVLLRESPSDVDRVLASRTPDRRDDLTVATLRTRASEPEVGLMGPYRWVWRPQLRQRERSGVLRPDSTSADYLVGMVRGLLFDGSIVDAVRADLDPGLLPEPPEDGPPPADNRLHR